MGSTTTKLAALGAAAALALAADVGCAQTGGEGFGDFVWNDLNQNGIQDAFEPGVPGVVVNLFRGVNPAAFDTDTTDATGHYLLSAAGVSNGGVSFVVQFILPAGFQFSPANQGASDLLDSDVIDFATGKTGGYMFGGPSEQSPNLSVDAGIFVPTLSVPEPATLATLGVGLAALGWKRRRRA